MSINMIRPIEPIPPTSTSYYNKEEQNKKQFKRRNYMGKIISNKVKCLFCGDIIESKSVHDFKWCSCKNVAVDGGKDYIKRCYKAPNSFEELSEIEGETNG